MNPRHRRHFDTIMQSPPTVYRVASIERLVKKHCKKRGIPDNLAAEIPAMIIVGLENDFYFKGHKKLMPAEWEFILDEPGRYTIKGVIDQLAFYENRAIVRDYKSQKNKFDNLELNNNIQAIIYALAVYKNFNIIPDVQFVLLRHPPTKEEPNNHIQIFPAPTIEELLGLEEHLAEMFKYFEKFDEKEAVKNFAADNADCKWLCGFGRTPFEKKKDGQPKFHCPYKFQLDYYILKNRDGEITKSTFVEDKPTPKEGQTLELVHYPGCARFSQLNYNRPQNESAPKAEAWEL